MMHFVIHGEETPAQLWDVGQLEILVVDEDGVIFLGKRAAFFELPLICRKGIEARQRRITEKWRLHIPANMLICGNGDIALGHRDRRWLGGLRGNVCRLASRRTQGQHHCKQ